MEYPSFEDLRADKGGAWLTLTNILSPKLRYVINCKFGTENHSEAEQIESSIYIWIHTKLRQKSKTEGQKFFFKNHQHMEALALIKARNKAIDYIRRVAGRKDSDNDCNDPERFGDWFNRWFKKFRPIPESKAAQNPAVEIIEKKFGDVILDDSNHPVQDDLNPNLEKNEMDLADILLNLLAVLKNEQREILMMIYLEDMTQKEVAAKLGMPIGTVGVYRQRGLDKIRDEIGRHPQLAESLNEKFDNMKMLPELILLALLIK